MRKKLLGGILAVSLLCIPTWTVLADTTEVTEEAPTEATEQTTEVTTEKQVIQENYSTLFLERKGFTLRSSGDTWKIKVSGHSYGLKGIYVTGDWTDTEDGRKYKRKDGTYPSDTFIREEGEDRNTNLYHVDENGVMSANEWYNGWWIDGNGEVTTRHASWHCNQDGWWFGIPDEWCARDEWLKVDGKWFYIDKDGYKTTGWITRGKKTYYMLPSGVMATGWTEVENELYYMNELGLYLTGEQQIDGITYHFGADGRLLD